MKNNAKKRLAVGLSAVCFFAGAAFAAPKKEKTDYQNGFQKNALFTAPATLLNELQESPCDGFQPGEAFDSFSKAFAAPEKVRCLTPELSGEDAAMKHLPAQIGSLVNLEVLSFGCLENLEDLPVEIGNLGKLKSLVIDNGNGCAMNVLLPRSIGKLQNLRVLRLYGALDARDVGIDEPARPRRSKPLPAEIGSLRRLESLDLGRNGLKTVPPQIASLTNLKTLHLGYNDLRALPAFIGNFRNLRELFINSTRVRDLPASMDKLRGLKVYMGDNGLKAADRKRLQARFPKIVFSFENEFD